MKGKILISNKIDDTNVIQYEDSNYNYILCGQHNIPRQGWKIHISCTLENHQEILDIVYNYCCKKKIDFKYIYNYKDLIYSLSGDAPQENVAKFITIYPSSTKVFIKVIEELYEQLHFYDGPYVVSDRRYRKSNIYYRYGVMESDSDYILDPLGNKLSDNRSYFNVPYFETDPFYFLEENVDSNYKYLNEIYKPYKSIHESSSGNVYKAKFNNVDVIIKEARNHILGFWGTAIDDLKNELNILRKLDDILGTPKLIDDFYFDENFYVVQEYLPGKPLSVASSDYFYQNLINYKNIIKSAYDLISSIHNKGIILNDISANNILIDSKTSNIYVCDFGSSYFVEEKNIKKNIGSTEGFYDNSINEFTSYNSDFHKLGYTLMSYIFPANNLIGLDKSGKSTLNQFEKYCKFNHIDYNVFNMIYLLIRQPYNWKNKFIKIFKDDQKKIFNVSIDKDNIAEYYNLLNSNIQFLKSEPHIENLTLGGIYNSNIKLLFIDSYKLKFKKYVRENHERIIKWIETSNDFTVGKGITGFGIILMMIFDDKEIEEINEYVDYIYTKINDKEQLIKSGDYLGISSGYLGKVLFNLLFSIREDLSTFSYTSLFNQLMYVNAYVKQIPEKNFYEFPVIVGKNISSPYLDDGLSGFLYTALILYKTNKLPKHLKIILKNDIIYPGIKTLLQDGWTKNAGLLHGNAGISYILYIASNILNKKCYLEKSIEYIYYTKFYSININNVLYFPNKEFSSLTNSFEDGTRGIHYVLEKIMNLRDINLWE